MLSHQHNMPIIVLIDFKYVTGVATFFNTLIIRHDFYVEICSNFMEKSEICLQ